MRRLILLLILAAVGAPLLLRQQGSVPSAVGTTSVAVPDTGNADSRADTTRDASAAAPTQDATPLAQAVREQRSYVYVQGTGTVAKVLREDTSGSRHQRFLVRPDFGGSVLIAHNIDIAPQVADLRPGTPIEFAGEYIWNEKGGLVHWTHHDPSGQHRAGWIQYQGRRYQ